MRPPSPSHEVVTPQTAATMTSMMKDVVCYGTAKYAKVPGMSVAGKTGTALLKPDVDPALAAAQKQQGTVTATTVAPTGETNPAATNDYQADDGTKEYFSTFVGFFPADHPQVTILVSIDRPDPSNQDHLGGTAAGPLFSTLATHGDARAARQPHTERQRLPRQRRMTAMARMLREVVEQAGLDQVEVIGDDASRSPRSTTTRGRSAPARSSAVSGERSPTATSLPQQARAAGAAALLVDHRLDVDLPQLVVPDTRPAMGWLAASFVRSPLAGDDAWSVSPARTARPRPPA